MGKIRALILGMGGNVSQGILKAIRCSGISCHIVGACVSQDAAGLYLCDQAYISPYAASAEFLPWLYDICKKERIQIVFSGVEEIIDVISPVRDDFFQNTGAVFRASAPEQLKIGRDKYLTCQWLSNHGFRAPACWKSGGIAPNAMEFPLIAKPRCGKSSAGVFIIKTPDDLDHAMNLTDYVIQECIGVPEQEYTVGCYCGLDGFIPTPIVMRRVLEHGASWKVEVVNDSSIAETAKRMIEIFLPDGPFNIQLRIDKDGTPVPFEFNIRFSGTTPMRAHFGFCDVKAMLLESICGDSIDSCFSIQKGVAMRYTNELYVFEDMKSLCDGRRLENKRIFTDRAGK